MKREEVRSLKRAVANRDSCERARGAALTLLEHSMACGHDRLAVRRLVAAVEVGAKLDATHWSYCESVLSRLKDLALLDFVISAINCKSGASTPGIN